VAGLGSKRSEAESPKRGVAGRRSPAGMGGGRPRYLRGRGSFPRICFGTDCFRSEGEQGETIQNGWRKLCVFDCPSSDGCSHLKCLSCGMRSNPGFPARAKADRERVPVRVGTVLKRTAGRRWLHRRECCHRLVRCDQAWRCGMPCIPKRDG